jgi:hypothetical protein
MTEPRLRLPQGRTNYENQTSDRPATKPYVFNTFAVGSASQADLLGLFPNQSGKGISAFQGSAQLSIIICLSVNKVVFLKADRKGGLSPSKSGENIFVFNGTREKLLASPAFQWTNTADRNYAEGIYRYYGLQPYWEEEMR